MNYPKYEQETPDETLEEPMDCAECGHKAEVTQYSAFALTSDDMWHCGCGKADCPGSVVRCGTRQEALDGWNQRQNWKREQQAKRAKGGNHLRKGDGGRKAAPVQDFYGQEIREGDTLRHPCGEEGTVQKNGERWFVLDFDGNGLVENRLENAVSDTWKGVVVKRAEVTQ